MQLDKQKQLKLPHPLGTQSIALIIALLFAALCRTIMDLLRLEAKATLAATATPPLAVAAEEAAAAAEAAA